MILSMNNCKFHVRGLFFKRVTMFVRTQLQWNATRSREKFPKILMCNWVDATCKFEPDYISLRAAIIANAWIAWLPSYNNTCVMLVPFIYMCIAILYYLVFSIKLFIAHQWLRILLLSIPREGLRGLSAVSLIVVTCVS